MHTTQHHCIKLQKVSHLNLNIWTDSLTYWFVINSNLQKDSSHSLLKSVFCSFDCRLCCLFFCSDLSCSCSLHPSRQTSLFLACVTWWKASTATASTCTATRRSAGSLCVWWTLAPLLIMQTSGLETDSWRYRWTSSRHTEPSECEEAWFMETFHQFLLIVCSSLLVIFSTSGERCEPRGAEALRGGGAH